QTTSLAKVRLIESYGAECRFVGPSDDLYAAARSIANGIPGGYYMDQFTRAERATDWRGNNNIAVSIFSQMSHERFPRPQWIVAAAGTGGTSTTIGRYI